MEDMPQVDPVVLIHAREDEALARRHAALLEAAGESVVFQALEAESTGQRRVFLLTTQAVRQGWSASLGPVVVLAGDDLPIDVLWADAARLVPADLPTWPEPSPCPPPSRGLQAFVEARLGGAPPALVAEEPDVGVFLHGRFLLLERLGNGPTTSAWGAIDLEGRRVTVRVLHPQWRGTPTAEAFLTGAESEPAFATVLARGDGAVPFVARTWAPLTLEDRLRDQDLPLDEAVEVLLEVARALGGLHERGGAHGHLKPANVLLLEGQVLLADPALPGRPAPEGGDVLYLAPETQEPGQQVGPPSDLYALGMTALAAFHDAPLPFWVLRDPERLLAELQVPSPIRQVVRACLDWDLERRCPSAGAFEQGLLDDEDMVRRLCERATEQGRHGDAAAYLARLMTETEQRSSALLLALGRARLAAGDTDAAREAFQEASLGRSRADVLAAARGLADVDAATGGDRVPELLARAEVLEPLGVELLVEAATGLGTTDREAARRIWERVVEHHLHPEQAREALRWLVDDARRAEDWSRVYRFGVQRHGFLPEAERAGAAWELGRLALEELGEPLRALGWMQLAAEGGITDPDLGRSLETIRSARGEWRQVVSLMLERAEGMASEDEAVDLMLRAARVALYAHNHHEDAASIMLRVLLRDPEHRTALRFLARHHARARRDDRALALYARLAPHEERGREGEPLEVRVADNVDYARLLLRNDRPRGAQLCLEAALDLNPTHIPTLVLASQLSYDLGKWDEARVATEGLVRAFSSAAPDATFCAALRRLGDLAWLHGDLVRASRHFNRVLELAPEDVESWWGRAKIALAGNAGRLDSDAIAAMPWLTAAPVRLTPHEALARLLAGCLQRSAMERWLRLDPMGKAMLELLSAQSDRVVASAVVDLLVARQLIRGRLFRRLGQARPAWERPIEAVEDLWFAGGSRSSFPIAESYRWSAGEVDFDPRHHREPLRVDGDPDGPVDVRASLSTLHHESAWKALLAWSDGELPEPPAAETLEVSDVVPAGRSAILVLTPDETEARTVGMARRILRVGDGEIIGAAMDEVSLPLATLEPEHARFEVVGEFFYVRAIGPVSVDGDPVSHRRLFGGETLRLGSVEARFLLDDRDLEQLHADRHGLSGEDDDLDAPFAQVPKAALFYTEGPHERMLPIVGDRVGVFEDPEGMLSMERGSTEAGVLVLQKRGEFYVRVGVEDSSRLLQHQDDFMVGSRLVQFRMLERLEEDRTALPEEADDVPLLLYDDGSRFGRPIPLDSDLFTLGRGRDADFQIAADASLSRVHCQLVREEGVTYVEDAGSSNGTQVNGLPIDGRVRLAHGDVILIGQTQLVYSDPAVPEHVLHTSGSLHDLVTLDEPTETVPVREIARRGLPVEEGMEKIRVVNLILREVFKSLDRQEGAGRGRAFLGNLVAARPRTYQGLLDGIEVEADGLPAMEVLYNLAQRAPQEQRPLLNFVLRDLIDRAVDAVAEILPDSDMDGLLTVLAETRYRDHLRF